MDSVQFINFEVRRVVLHHPNNIIPNLIEVKGIVFHSLNMLNPILYNQKSCFS
jgi:hypothetical protein